MLYTVHTNFTALDEETGFIRKYARTDKIEAHDKDFAKYIAWEQILDCGKYKFLSYDSQNARSSKR